MGKIYNGILGGFSGKVGPVVGAAWKGIQYMRAYVVPANPNSSGQQAQRAKMSAMVAMGRKVLSTLLNIYWDPFVSGMSGFNKFISVNISTLNGSNHLVAASKLSVGTLEGVDTSGATYNTGDGETVITWDETVTGNGALTDSVGLVVYDAVDDNFQVFTPAVTRDDESITVTATTGLTPTSVFAYLFFYRGTSETFVVSDSLGRSCAAR